MVQIDYRLEGGKDVSPIFFPAVYLFNFFCPSTDKTGRSLLSIDSQPNRNGWLTCTGLIIIFQSRFNGAGENAPRRAATSASRPRRSLQRDAQYFTAADDFFIRAARRQPQGQNEGILSYFFLLETGPVLVQLRCSSRYFCVWYSPNVGLSLASRTLQINVRFGRLCVLGSNKRLARLPELFLNELVV
jgi:hypothetical protein